jgi:hypothetical protein
MTMTGKRARKQYGNRFAAKRAKRRKRVTKVFGTLPPPPSHVTVGPDYKRKKGA